MSSRVITGIVSLCFALTGLFLANMFLMMMIGEINRKRRESELVSYVGFSFPKILRIFSDYRRSYPGGNTHVLALAAFAVAVLSLVTFAICLRIIG